MILLHVEELTAASLVVVTSGRRLNIFLNVAL